MYSVCVVCRVCVWGGYLSVVCACMCLEAGGQDRPSDRPVSCPDDGCCRWGGEHSRRVVGGKEGRREGRGQAERGVTGLLLGWH